MKALRKLSELAKSAAVRALVWTVCLSLASGPALAAVPANIIYQGSMRRSGAPYSGPATFVFRITDAAGGPTYWTSGNQVLTVTGSFFRYALGTPNQAAFNLIDWANITPYIEVTVDGTTLLPREQLNAVPYAIYAGSIPYVSPGAAGVQVSNNLFVTGGSLGVGTSAPGALLDVNGTARTGYLTITPAQSVLLGRAPLIANEATTKAYVDAIAGVGGGGVLASTNTWSAWQTHLNQVTYSTDVYFSAGRLNMLGNRVTTVAGKLDATQLANTVPAATMVGAYPTVTGVGTLTAGTWNAATVDPTYGGTGANLSAGAAGGVPYFTGGGVMGAVPAGTAGQVLESNGAGAPGWVSPNQSSLLASTNTWSAWQTHLNQVTYSTDVYFSAGRINLQGNRVTTLAGKLDATHLVNTVPLATLSGITNAQLASGTFGNITGIVNAQLAAGSFSNITGVGTLTAGAWNATAISPAYGGTGSNLSGGVLGGMPYFTAGGVMAAVGAGTAGQLLQSNGAAPPSWVTGQTLANNLVGGAIGSIPYQTAPNSTAMLPAGLAGQLLMANGAAAPSWTTGYPNDFIFSGGYGSVAGGPGDLTIGAGGSSPNSASIKFGDNTGWKYHVGTNVASVFTPRLTVIDTGNVGIGTPSPGYPLQINRTNNGTALGNSTLTIENPAGTQSLLSFTFAGAQMGSIRVDSSGNLILNSFGGNNYYGYDDTTLTHRFFTSGTEKLRIRNDGNVGIGVTNPVQPLDIAGNAQMSGGALIGSMGGTWSGWNETIRLNTGSHAAITNPTGGLLFGLHSNSNFYWADTVAGQYVMSLALGGLSVGNAGNSHVAGNSGDTYFGVTTGSIGIGTSSPNAKLEVVGSILQQNTNTLQARDSGGTAQTWMWPRWSDNMMYTNFGTAGWNIRNNASSPVMFMQNGGNVGIGTTSPTAKLHIGGIAGTDGIRFPDGSLMLTASLGSAGILTNFNNATIQSDSDNNGGGETVFQSGPTTVMTIKNDGKVGINDTAPGYLLDVNGQINSTSKITALAAAGTSGGFSFEADGSQDTGMFSPSDGILDFYNNGSRRMRLDTSGNMTFNASNPQLISGSSYIEIPNGLYVSGGARLYSQVRIDARDGIEDSSSGTLQIYGGTLSQVQIAGNTGIGQAPGGYRLEVNGDTYTQGWFRSTGQRGWYNETYGGGWRMDDTTWIRSHGSKQVYIDSFLRADGGIASGNIASDGGGTIRTTGNIRTNADLRVDGNLTCLQGVCPPNNAMRMTPNFHLNAPAANAVIMNWDNGATGDTRTMRVGNGGGIDVLTVTAAGRVAAGNYWPSSSDPIFTVNGDAQKSGGGSWIAFSDARLKDLGSNYQIGLAEVLKLQPIRYRYKTDNAMGIKDATEHIGFSAQEVEKVIPDAVTFNGKGYRGVNNDPIMWAMLNAIKEQQKQIEALKAEIKQLKKP